MMLSANELPGLWARYVSEQNIDAVINLYHEDFVLTPTFSPQVICSLEKLCDYFYQLAEKKTLTVSVYEKSLLTQSINQSAHIISGTYAFHFTEDGIEQIFPARFTYVIDLAKEKPILHHHSSQLPGNFF